MMFMMKHRNVSWLKPIFARVFDIGAIVLLIELVMFKYSKLYC